ncbi:hypothetical protein BDN72DRAFT_896523 [Pluteus cervinus]|uniref:Uncharacterized protein n=1 Tax=Pluteus cervinus TaxID=181527 RepID=A0ACD3AXZ1_9AGAR|nr:hypothetical protein BDN72DRAFT_896523 [Pluteus cervinus]
MVISPGPRWTVPERPTPSTWRSEYAMVDELLPSSSPTQGRNKRSRRSIPPLYDGDLSDQELPLAPTIGMPLVLTSKAAGKKSSPKKDKVQKKRKRNERPPRQPPIKRRATFHTEETIEIPSDSEDRNLLKKYKGKRRSLPTDFIDLCSDEEIKTSKPIPRDAQSPDIMEIVTTEDETPSLQPEPIRAPPPSSPCTKSESLQGMDEDQPALAPEPDLPPRVSKLGMQTTHTGFFFDVTNQAPHCPMTPLTPMWFARVLGSIPKVSKYAIKKKIHAEPRTETLGADLCLFNKTPPSPSQGVEALLPPHRDENSTIQPPKNSLDASMDIDEPSPSPTSFSLAYPE